MKNILIIRSASMATMDKLINYLKENNKNQNVYCLIQKGSMKTFKRKIFTYKIHRKRRWLF